MLEYAIKPYILLHVYVSSWMKKRMDMWRETNYYMPYSEELDSCQEYQVYGMSARSRGNKVQSGLSYRLHYREPLSPPSAGDAQSTNFGLL